jgi:hypothetical protein
MYGFVQSAQIRDSENITSAMTYRQTVDAAETAKEIEKGGA